MRGKEQDVRMRGARECPIIRVHVDTGKDERMAWKKGGTYNQIFECVSVCVHRIIGAIESCIDGVLVGGRIEQRIAGSKLALRQ